jgi:hypothetical protein
MLEIAGSHVLAPFTSSWPSLEAAIQSARVHAPEEPFVSLDGRV